MTDSKFEVLAIGPSLALHMGLVGGMEVYFLCVFHTKLTGGGLVCVVIEALIILSCGLSEPFEPIRNILTKALADLFIKEVTSLTHSQLTFSSLAVCS